MEGGNLRFAQLERTVLSKARLQGADLSCDISKLSQDFESCTNLKGADLSLALLENANLSYAWLEEAILRKARLQGADLSHAVLDGADLSEAVLEGANLHRTGLNHADLRRTRLKRTDLSWALLQGADLILAELDSADLRRARLEGADLRDWSIVRTSLRSVDFTGAKNLSQESVNTAFGDADTTLPKGIDPPCHWEGIEARFYLSLDDDPAYQTWLADYGKWPCLEAAAE